MSRTFDKSAKVGAVCGLVAGLACLLGGLIGSSPLVQFGRIGLVSIVIWQACEPFAAVAQWVGRRYRIPGSVRGATLDAVASSLPELFIGIFFVIYFGDFAATVATCAGSAVYNMLVIPACCTLAIGWIRPDRPRITISPEVLKRDGLWFLVSELALIYCLFTHRVSWTSALVFLALYAGYVGHLIVDTRAYRRGPAAETARRETLAAPHAVSLLGGLVRLRLTPLRAAIILGLATTVTGLSCYVLVGACEAMARSLDVPTFFVAVIIAAAASSVPDTMLSIGAAVRGDDSGAISNAFGSNTFDVNICLAVPVLLYAFQHGGQDVPWSSGSGVVPLAVLLWVFSAVTLGLMWHRLSIGRGKALILLGMYAVFVTCAVVGSLAAD